MRGGCLVTDALTRPIEFWVSGVIRPTSIQRILYGDTLHEYICNDLVGIPLLSTLESSPDLILVRCGQRWMASTCFRRSRAMKRKPRRAARCCRAGCEDAISSSHSSASATPSKRRTGSKSARNRKLKCPPFRSVQGSGRVARPPKSTRRGTPRFQPQARMRSRRPGRYGPLLWGSPSAWRSCHRGRWRSNPCPPPYRWSPPWRSRRAFGWQKNRCGSRDR